MVILILYFFYWFWSMPKFYCRAIYRCCPLYCISDNFLNVRIVVGWKTFMTWSKIEYLSFSSVVTAATSKHLTASKPADKYQCIRGWNVKALSVHFLMRQLYIFTNAVCNW